MVFVLQPLLIGVLGLVGAVIGGALAHRSETYPGSYGTSHTIAGFLLIIGFGCFGVALSLVFATVLRDVLSDAHVTRRLIY
jgi:hypothetical protein